MKAEVLKRYKDKVSGVTYEVGNTITIEDKARLDELEFKGFIKSIEVKKKVAKKKAKTVKED